MSDLMEGLLKRRSVRAYKPDMVPQEAIDKILGPACGLPGQFSL